ncbi:MAG: hypothetical protein LCI03_01735 [Actinobacteria bacterium]|nr:hypothetical protein [Actinomycetota bacterium]
MDDFDEPEAYSPETLAALRSAVRELGDALVEHVELLAGLHGGSAEMAGLFAANEKVADLIAAWNERVLDHTGTSPVYLLDRDDDFIDEEEPDDDGTAVADGDILSVISRWDLQVEDVDALVSAGREAHRRNRPEEDTEDAAVAVDGAALAIYAVLHEKGEPFYQLPGVAVLSGLRVFVRPDDAVAVAADEISDEVYQPPGEVLFSESWI